MAIQVSVTQLITGLRMWRAVLTGSLAMAVLTGCLDSVPTQELPETTQTVQSYTGPAPATDDVRAFMTNLWDNVKATNRCGGCHGAGGQVPMFARQDDVNLAYSEAISYVDLGSPADSRLVTKVGGGHNCWLDSNSACAAVMTAYIQAWAGDSGAEGSSNQIDLVAPTIKDPGASKNFPDFAAVDASTWNAVHNLLKTYCSECHTDTSQTPQAPFFAVDDSQSAYEAVRSSQKMDLNTPANSRLVVRLRSEFHNCWSDCAANAQQMEDAITAFAATITPDVVDPSLITSKALNLGDGVVAAGGDRYEANLIALYEFKTGSGNTVFDTSGIEPGMHLTVTGTEGVDYNWVGGWGMQFISAKAQATTASSKKLYDFIKASGEYSIEAWVVPGNVTQEEARIISYSAGTDARNFTMQQTLYNYEFFLRSSTTDANGEPPLATADADEDLQATLQHVVMTYDPVNGRRIYVNGQFTDDVDATPPGNLNDWDDTFAFVLANEVSNDRQWNGTIRLVAIHNRALTAEQIQQNFEAGVGEKFFLLFSVGDVIGVPNTYVMMEVSQFDSYSYLFKKPTFISLDANPQLGSIPIQGIRIGLNGKEPAVGQAYRNVNTTVTDASYTPNGQVLSNVGTIIAIENGADADEFFLTFERLGDQQNVVVEAVPPPPAAGADLDPASDIGLRTFDEINASMSVITGVPTTDSNVQATFDTIKQQLPTVENVEGFLSSHQVAVSQLAIEYCNALVSDTSLRSSYFPAVNFSSPANTQTDAIIDPLLASALGNSVNSQPDPTAVKSELQNLINNLVNSCGGSCPADRTETVVKAVCSAVIGSAAVLLQ